jgi:hypothetical protein
MQGTQQTRPAAVTVLVVIAVIAGLSALLNALRYMGWLPVTISTSMGDLTFNMPAAQWLGALIELVIALIWFSVARQLASLDQRGWWFVVIISVINLIYLVLVVLGPAPMQAVWWGIVINAIALILALLPSTQVAFGRQPGRTA